MIYFYFCQSYPANIKAPRLQSPFLNRAWQQDTYKKASGCLVKITLQHAPKLHLFLKTRPLSNLIATFRCGGSRPCLLDLITFVSWWVWFIVIKIKPTLLWAEMPRLFHQDLCSRTWNAGLFSKSWKKRALGWEDQSLGTWKKVTTPC